MRGANVMLGYWDRPEETAEALRGGWMHTGDGGYMDDDGYIYHRRPHQGHDHHRRRERVLGRGRERHRPAPGGVATCAVIGVPDETWGERVHAVVVPGPARTLTAEELTRICKERIAGYKMPAQSIDVVDALPLSGAGKVLKRELRRLHAEDSAPTAKAG